MIFRKLSLTLILTAALHQCAKNNDARVLGNYRDALSVTYAVDDAAWQLTYPGTGTCKRTLSNFDWTTGYAKYSETGSACFNAGKYGKFFFQKDASGTIWLCDYIKGKASLNDISDESAPDSTSPSTNGCNGKAWTKLSATDSNFAIAGSFTDNYSSSHSFSNTLWSTGGCTNAIIFYDNTNGFFLYQQQADAGCWAANNYKFGKVFWTVDSSSKLYYCQLFYDKTSYLDVANSTTKPTYTNPSASGCGGFSWTQLIR